MKNGNHDISVANEERAKRLLIENGVIRARQFCPSCGSGTTGLIRREKFRCRDCGREWGLRKGSILDRTRISYQTFISLVQFFADDVPAYDAAGRLSIAYNTANEMYARIGTVVTGNHRSAPGPAVNRGLPEVQPAVPRTNETAGEVPVKRSPVVFGIRSSGNTVTIEKLDNPESAVIPSLPVPSMQRGNILFIDAYGRKYQGFIVYEPDRHGEEVIRIRSHNGFPWSPLAGFWTYAGAAWKRHRGVNSERIPAFLQELAFRFNNRNRDLFPLVLEMIGQATSLES